MHDPVHAFLATLGSRPLTYEEAGALQMLYIKAGTDCSVAPQVLRLVADEARYATQGILEDATTASASA